MTTRLTLICQGATVATRASAFPADDVLEGRALSAIEGIPPIGWRADSINVSPMRAARQTAAALALRGDEDVELRDIDYGNWAGRTIADIAREQPEMLRQWRENPGFDGHAGESIASLLGRAGKWLEGRASAGGHTIAVTHAAVTRAMIAHLLGAPGAFWNIDIAPLSLTDIRHDGRRWVMRSCGLPIVARSAGSAYV
jgi:broad specificity phosphatase PhoE